MTVRRTLPVVPGARHGRHPGARRASALGAVLLTVLPMAACGTEVSPTGADVPGATSTAATGSGSPGAADVTPPASPPAAEGDNDATPIGDPAAQPPDDPGGTTEGSGITGHHHAGTDLAPGQERPGRKVLEGGGLATAVPGSDAPDREHEVGPQYAVTADLDIREIERLVKAVEAIAKAQRVRRPLDSGGSVAAAVGTFSYRWFADGTVAPDPAWVGANIRTGKVPVLGSVTCHRVMFPQLRSALQEVVARGLAGEIHPDEFGGCYVPRFIGRDPSKGLSLHTWGIAVDLNVPGNQRGVPGEIDRDVVAIFKKWGFAWGGDWAWTDPMHFELARLVRSR